MSAYLLLVAALLSRILPHSGWFGFTAVGGSLLYFGARRSWREMLIPSVALAATDYYLTVYAYNYPFQAVDYAITWGWYLAAIVLGHVLLAPRVTLARVATASVLGPTSFFFVSNYAAWFKLSQLGGMYAHTSSGLVSCLAAGIPFYERDLASTGLILALVFGIPAAIRRFESGRALPGRSAV